MLDARFARLADELIPTRDGLPSASEADPQGKWLARALAARPDLVPAYERALEAPEARGLERSDPEAFAALTEIAAGAYTMNVKVRKRPFGRSHDVSNLFVVDGSVFVTSGPQPPTATIAANAARCAAHIIATAGLQAIPA
jgi:hypothetical protein